MHRQTDKNKNIMPPLAVLGEGIKIHTYRPKTAVNIRAADGVIPA